jgi:hypothetical protein
MCPVYRYSALMAFPAAALSFGYFSSGNMTALLQLFTTFLVEHGQHVAALSFGYMAAITAACGTRWEGRNRYSYRNTVA